jgi:lysophospholipase L1-like esterase
MKKNVIGILIILVLTSFVINSKKKKPTLYLIGDSTVEDGSGGKGLWGWGKFLPTFFDTSKISIRNYAQGGTSTRSFYTGGIWNKSLNKRGMWDTVNTKLVKGDYLLIQFGFNDQSPVDDSTRSRGTLKGIGEDSVLIYNKVTKKPETVHSFGWYLQQYIHFARSKGVTVIVCSSLPKNLWKDGKLVRGENGFADWAIQAAKKEHCATIDLNNLISDIYEGEGGGEKVVTEKYHIATDNTHTTELGAKLNAATVAKSIRSMNISGLSKLVLKDKVLQIGE